MSNVKEIANITFVWSEHESNKPRKGNIRFSKVNLLIGKTIHIIQKYN